RGEIGRGAVHPLPVDQVLLRVGLVLDEDGRLPGGEGLTAGAVDDRLVAAAPAAVTEVGRAERPVRRARGVCRLGRVIARAGSVADVLAAFEAAGRRAGGAGRRVAAGIGALDAEVLTVRQHGARIAGVDAAVAVLAGVGSVAVQAVVAGDRVVVRVRAVAAHHVAGVVGADVAVVAVGV